MAFIAQLKELAAAKASVSNQEKKLNEDRTRALASLHSEFGYSDLKLFIQALKVAAKARKTKRGKKPNLAKAAKKPRLTAEAKAALVEAARAGKSSAELSKEFGVSIATVQNFKKAAGLVKTRSGK